jgi:hypothetical protein
MWGRRNANPALVTIDFDQHHPALSDPSQTQRDRKIALAIAATDGYRSGPRLVAAGQSTFRRDVGQCADRAAFHVVAAFVDRTHPVEQRQIWSRVGFEACGWAGSGGGGGATGVAAAAAPYHVAFGGAGRSGLAVSASGRIEAPEVSIRPDGIAELALSEARQDMRASQ